MTFYTIFEKSESCSVVSQVGYLPYFSGCLQANINHVVAHRFRTALLHLRPCVAVGRVGSLDAKPQCFILCFIPVLL